jgi:hypothetical protein
MEWICCRSDRFVDATSELRRIDPVLLSIDADLSRFPGEPSGANLFDDTKRAHIESTTRDRLSERAHRESARAIDEYRIATRRAKL